MSWAPWGDTIKALGFEAGGIYGLDGSVWVEFGENVSITRKMTNE